MDRKDAVAAALQLQHDADLMTSNLQVLGQFVTFLNRMSSEVMRLAFGPEVFLSEAVNVISPVHEFLQVASLCGVTSVI